MSNKTKSAIMMMLIFAAILPQVVKTSITVDFGEVVSGTIDPAGDVDTYIFSAIANNTILIRMSRVSGSLWPALILYSPNGTELKRDYGPDVAEANYTLAETGEYTVNASDYWGDYTGNYSIFVQGLSNPGNAVSVGFGETVCASIDPAGEVDTYTFSANASDTVLVRVSQVSGFLWPELRLYLPNGTEFGDYDPKVAEIYHTLAEDGNYTVLVFDHFGDYTGNYSVFFQGLSNPGNAVSVGFGETVCASIDPAGEVDTYTFSANASDTVLVRVSQVSGFLWPELRLYLPNGTEFGDYDPKVAEIYHTLAEDGNYTVLVFDHFGDYTGNYTLTFSVAILEELTLAIPYVSNISTGEWHTFFVRVEGSENLLVKLEPTASPGPLELYGRYAQACTQSDYDYVIKRRNILGNYELLISPTKNGTYYLAVHGRDVEDVAGYRITASIVDCHVSDIYPRTLPNSARTTVHISGIGFTSGMRVELRNGTTLTIRAETVVLSSSKMMIAHFNLSSAPLGLYDMAVVWSDDHEDIFHSAVEISMMQEGALYSLPDFQIEEGTAFTFDIAVADISNLFVTLQKTTLISYGNSWSAELSLLHQGEEVASISGSHDLILHIVNPEPGTYTISVMADDTGSGILTLWATLPELPLGEWVVSTIYCSYGSTWFQVEVSPEQDSLCFEAEAMGAWSHFDIYYEEYGSSDHWVSRQGTQTSIEIPSPASGTYIVEFMDSAMLYSDGQWNEDQARDILIRVDATFSVEPPPSYLPTITSISTDRGGNTGLATIEIKGGWLDPNATVSLVRSGYEDITAQSVYGISDGTALTMTFNLLDKSPGEWKLVVTNPDGCNATAPSSFTIEECGEPELWVEIVGREQIRVGRPARYILRYGNLGKVDMPAPLFVISISAPALSPESKYTGLSLLPVSQPFEKETIKVFGKGSLGSPGILSPGSFYSIPFYVKVQDSEAVFELQVSTVSIDPIFEVRNLASFSDEFCPAPGISLELTRIFPEGSMPSSNPGSLGHGWIHNYEVNLEELNDGTVALLRGNSYKRFYLRNSDCTYTPLRDYSTLTRNPDNTFQIREKDGTIYGFRTDLKLDYIEDSNRNRISAVYNSNSQLVKLQHSSGDYFSLEYNERGRISRLIDHAGLATEYQYDESGELLISVTTPDGIVTSYNYTSNGLSSISYPEGIQQFFEYDEDGQLAEEYLDNGEELIRYSYDVSSGATHIIDAMSNITTVCVDEFGGIIRLENDLGAITQYEYGKDFNLIRMIDPLGNTYDFDYDERGNVISITDPMGNRITMEYDVRFNKLVWLRDARGNEITFDYGEYGNLLNITYANSSTELMNYDTAGNLVNVITRKGDAISYTYNSRGQLTRKDYPDGSWIAYEYDAAGNMISATDESGTIEMEYNTRNTLTRITYPTGHFLDYNYDNAGRLIQRVDQDGNALNYEYDVASRLVRISDESGSDIVRYKYDAIGRLNKRTVGSGAYTTYEYDAADQIIHLINYDASGKVLSRFDYTRDLLGNPISMTTLEGTYNYEYDRIGQLTKATYPDGHYISYFYDAAGNRIAVVNDGETTSYTSNNMNQYTEVGNASYSYDANGNLIFKTEDGQTTTYEYNFENRLTKVTSPEGTWEYVYDPLGNRIGVINNGIEHRYLVDPMGFGDVVGEYDGDGNLIARYTHGLGLISKIDGGGNNYYYHFDPTGHTIEITNENGNVVNSYEYSPFGECTGKEEAIPNPFEYVGEFGVIYEGNGLLFMRARHYEPDLGRFITADPLNLAAGDHNLYRYAFNSPTTAIDPMGLKRARIWPMIQTLSSATIEVLSKIGKVGPFGKIVGSGLSVVTSVLNIAKGAREIVIGTGLEKLHGWGWSGLGIMGLGMFVFSPPGWVVTPCVLIGATTLGSIFDILGGWGDEIQSHEIQVKSVSSSTPENKFGPTGYDSAGTPYEDRKRFVPPDKNFYYIVEFWNKENATAPACDVFVKDQLDTDIDWVSFRFEEIGFLNWTVELEPCQYFNVYVDTRPQMDLIVNVEGTFDPNTGEMSWTFRSLDSTTMETPDDPMAGFLPPITEIGYEVGWVCFSVNPEVDLPTGTRIENQAFVNFDGVGPYNPAPKEGPFVNVIDAAPPTSNVTAALNGETVQLNWTGNDLDGSGIKDYIIYVSKDGNPYESWLLHTTNSSAAFVGESGHTYAFYSIARDNVGNTEEGPTEPDVTLTIEVSGINLWIFAILSIAAAALIGIGLYVWFRRRQSGLPKVHKI